MKPFIIDRQSWHCRLVMKMTLWGQIRSRNDLNLCAYSRALALSVIRVVLISILATGVTISIASVFFIAPLYAGVAWLFSLPANEWTDMGHKIAPFEMLLALGYVSTKAGKWLAQRICGPKHKLEKKAEPGLLTTALSNFHTKTCARVEISNYHDDFR